MRLVSWLFRIVFFTVALLFAAANIKTNTELNIGVDMISAPLVLFLLAFFVAGVVLGLLSVVPTLFRQRREIGRLRKEIKVAARMPAGPQQPQADFSVTPDPASPASRMGL
jgi:putative membrane protein